MQTTRSLGTLTAAVCKQFWQQQPLELAGPPAVLQALLQQHSDLFAGPPCSRSCSSWVQQPPRQIGASNCTGLNPGSWGFAVDRLLQRSNTCSINSTRGFSSCSSSWHGDSSSSDSGSSPPPGRSQGKDMAMVFTCAKCDTRSVKAFSRQSYEKGLVLIRCPGCQALHLIADNLGWFGDATFKIDEYLAAQGQAVKRVSLDDLQQPAGQDSEEQLTAEDLAGWSMVQQLLSTVAGASQHTQGAAPEQGISQSSHSSAASAGCDATASRAVSAGEGAAGSCQAGTAAAPNVDSGVVQVAPEDVQAWLRVQQQQQNSPGDTAGSKQGGV